MIAESYAIKSDMRKRDYFTRWIMHGGFGVLLFAAFLWLRDRVWFYPALFIVIAYILFRITT